MNYLFYALIAAFCFALSQILNKLLSKHSIDNKDSMMVYFMASSFTFGIFLLPFVPLTIPSFEVIKLMSVVVSMFLLGYYAFFTGLYDADASSFAPLFQMQAGLVGLLAFIFLGERFPIDNYFWMGLLIFGAILVSIDEKFSIKSFFNKGIALILLMQVLHAISNLFIGFTLKLISPIEILFWENMAIGIICLLFILIKKPNLNYKFKQVAPMFLSSFVVGIGVIALFRAFAVNLTISSVIGLLSAPIVFVFSLVASKVSPTFLEYHPAKVYLIRGIGLLVILLGAYQIAI